MSYEVSGVRAADDFRSHVDAVRCGEAVVFHDGGREVAVLIPAASYRAVCNALRALHSAPSECWGETMPLFAEGVEALPALGDFTPHRAATGH